MFNGSKNVPPKEYDRILESNGGYSNAFTDRDMTAYYEDIASDRLDVLFRLDCRSHGVALAAARSSSRARSRWSRRSGALRTDNDISGMLDEQLYAAAFHRVALPLAGGGLDGRPQPHHPRRDGRTTSAPLRARTTASWC
mgnify:CR=1 FL=1